MLPEALSPSVMKRVLSSRASLVAEVDAAVAQLLVVQTFLRAFAGGLADAAELLALLSLA
jgi:hypothetical protein